MQENLEEMDEEYDGDDYFDELDLDP